MDKRYKVSYKTYLNDRLKKVYLHGNLTYPLYVQVTFDRKTIVFKSYYFELFSKPRYFLQVAGISKGPDIAQITEKEHELIGFIIDRHPADFSLELFKKDYAYYSIDLLDIMEAGFIEYLYTFFQDEGMSYLATTIKEGLRVRAAYDVVRDMKRAFQKPLYERLVENSLWYAPPYLPLYTFMQQAKRWPMLSFSVMEWGKPQTIPSFEEYAEKYYPQREAKELTNEIEQIVSAIKKQSNTASGTKG